MPSGADPEFHREMYQESGNQVRGMNALRNTTLSLVGVGVVAFIGLLAQGDNPDKRLWAIPMVFAVFGLSLHLLTWPYIHTALERQRAIAKAYASPRLMEIVGSDHFKDRVSFRILPLAGWWDNRLDVVPVFVYLGLIGVALAALCGWDVVGLT